ncbi:hypothetical protein N0V82_005936 [Gnomoniopsis sp. IMI 355080]|nr:hypothetical protein N0V82_005936 [Gnomoniopsis sp. IMI 355080]
MEGWGIRMSPDEDGTDPAVVIGKTFGLFRGEEETVYQMASASPFLLPVALRRGHAELGVDGLRNLKIPSPTREENTKFGIGEHVLQYIRHEKSTTYELMAVVRLRGDTDGERDFVRLYQGGSQKIEPHGDPARREGYVDDSWSIEDEGDYMLYYVRLDRSAERPQTKVDRGTAEEIAADRAILAAMDNDTKTTLDELPRAQPPFQPFMSYSDDSNEQRSNGNKDPSTGSAGMEKVAQPRTEHYETSRQKQGREDFASHRSRIRVRVREASEEFRDILKDTELA